MAKATKKPESKASKLKRLKKLLADYLKTPVLKEGEPVPELLWGMSPFQQVKSNIDFKNESRESIIKKLDKLIEDTRNEEFLAIARAELKLSKESSQKNLVILHRTQLVSIAALIVAIFALALSH